MDNAHEYIRRKNGRHPNEQDLSSLEALFLLTSFSFTIFTRSLLLSSPHQYDSVHSISDFQPKQSQVQNGGRTHSSQWQDLVSASRSFHQQRIRQEQPWAKNSFHQPSVCSTVPSRRPIHTPFLASSTRWRSLPIFPRNMIGLVDASRWLTNTLLPSPALKKRSAQSTPPRQRTSTLLSPPPARPSRTPHGRISRERSAAR